MFRSNIKKQWFILIVVAVFLDFVSFVYFSGSSASQNSEYNPLTVSQVYTSTLLGEEVYVKGKVIEVLPDYVSKKGYAYQQFIISDGIEKIKIFCSQKYGKVDVIEGEEIVFNGKFQKYYNEFEIYGFCSEIKRL
ncbi:MAG: hypothetical protein QW051_01255 [Candidatus Aenigmatarchaeota archaeon]